MDIQETKVITEVKTVIVGYKCDNCGKIHNGDFPDEWHHFSSHHNEWGNDSIDSYEYYDVCSPECYVDKLTDVVESEMSGIHNVLRLGVCAACTNFKIMHSLDSGITPNRCYV